MGCLIIVPLLMLCVDELQRTGALALAFDGVEVPAVVDTAERVRRSSKSSTWFEWRVTASAAVDGQRVVAHGTLSAEAAAGDPVTAFVPHRRSDLAVAYRGSGPPLFSTYCA